MSLIMTGIDHNSAGLDVRGLFSLTRKETESFCSHAVQAEGVSGCVAISTCNRTEIWLSLSHGADADPFGLLAGWLGLEDDRYRDLFTVRRDRDAVEHLFRLASGMESMILGEDQIVTQVGEALALSRSTYASGHVLEVLFRYAVTAAKRVKTETVLTSADASVINAALGVLSGGGFDPEGKKCLVIGNGMMGKLCAETLVKKGADVTVTVRRYHSGLVEIPDGCGRTDYDRRTELLPLCDLVISATSSPNLTLTADMMPVTEGDREIILLDLAVPRDIDPAVAGLKGYRLLDIDGLNIDSADREPDPEMLKAEGIIAEEEEKFFKWYEGIDLVPLIDRVKTCAGEDTAARMTAFLAGAGLDGESSGRISEEAAGAASRMMNHLLHGLKGKIGDSEFKDCLDAMDEIFSEKEMKQKKR